MTDVACPDAPATAASHAPPAAGPSSTGRLQTSATFAAAVAVPGLLKAADSLRPKTSSVPLKAAPRTVSRVQASRLLAQASMGASTVDIASVQGLGIAGWVDSQLAMPREISLWDWLVSKGYRDGPQYNDVGLMDIAVWRQAITAPDQLRQRIGHALLDIFAVGADGLSGYAHGFGMAAYVDLLMDGAFGSFRDLLGNIAANVSMASWLTFLNSYKANPWAGTHPDENFAREVMQLFTIGLYQLNPNGTRQLSGDGTPIETYTQDDITGLARVFTGWTWPSGDLSRPDVYRLPIALDATQHETGAKSFLGTTIPAGTDGYTSRSLALDTLAAHTNVGPFIGRQLIQRMVTSNPSPSYIGRVAAVFADDGHGVRGNLGAVVRAILLDPEARVGDNADLNSAPNPAWGRLRTPAQRVTNWARAFAASSPSDTWPIGDLSTPWRLLGYSPGHAPSVFNFFRPGYTPPGSPFAAQGLVAPELQITTEPCLISYINYMQMLIAGNVYANDIAADYSGLLAFNGNADLLMAELNVLLAAGHLSASTVKALTTAVSSIDTSTAYGLYIQIYAAVLLVLAAPEYLVQK